MATENDVPPVVPEQGTLTVDGGSGDVEPVTASAQPDAPAGHVRRRGIVVAAIVVVVLFLAGMALALVPRSADSTPQAEGAASPNQTPLTTGTATVDPTAAGPTSGAAAPGGAATSGGSVAWTPPAPLPPPGGGNPPAGLSRPAAPSDLVVETVDISRIRFRWTDNADNEGGYTIIRHDGQRVDLAANTTLGSPVRRSTI